MLNNSLDSARVARRDATLRFVGTRYGLVLLASAATLAAGAAAAQTSAAPTAQTSAEFRRQMQEVHDRERRAVGVSVLQWDDTLARDAQGWADTIARDRRDGPSMHSAGANNGSYGENIRWTRVGATDENGAGHAQWWANERNNYVNGEFSMALSGNPISRTGSWWDIGHYSQMVWSRTNRFGCAHARTSEGDRDYAVCRYSPGGNAAGQWAYNAPVIAPEDLQATMLQVNNAIRPANAQLTWDPALASEATAEAERRISMERGVRFSTPMIDNEVMGTAGGQPAAATYFRDLIASGFMRTRAADVRWRRMGCGKADAQDGSERQIVCRYGPAN